MFRPFLSGFTALISLAACGVAQEKACAPVTFDSTAFTVCRFAANDPGLRLVLKDPTGAPIGQFDRLAELSAARGETLRFAMNAGMYHDDRSPVGHYVEQSEETVGLMLNPRGGNFAMLPNGVFWIDETGAGVSESHAYAERFGDTRPAFATQSGPMLVIDGALHPAFNAEGTSRKRRNGVGVSGDGATLYFAISDEPVNFHSFARLFRDELKSPQALFFDGTVSRLYAPEIDRNETGSDLGPMVAIVIPADAE